MTFSEKIAACRRRAGLSQEALAEKVGVSRQSVSKWETGEASPEVGKLAALARALGVTADWLLSQEPLEAMAPPEASPALAPLVPAASAPEHPPEASCAAPAENAPSSPEELDWAGMPRFLVRMAKRYGWVYGVYTAIGGAVMTAFGFLMRAVMGSFSEGVANMGGFSGDFGFPGDFSDVIVYDASGRVIHQSSGGGSVFAPMDSAAGAVSGFVIVLGLLTMVGGIWLAMYLRRRGQP